MIGRTLRLLETDGMNMRIVPYLLLIILVLAGYFLPISNAAQDPNRTNAAAHQLTPSQFDPDTDLSRPIFDHITGADVEIIRERNDTLGFGAIIRAEVNQNITIFYTLVNGNNETDLRLYADVPNQNLTTSRAGFTNQSLAEFKNGNAKLDALIDKLEAYNNQKEIWYMQNRNKKIIQKYYSDAEIKQLPVDMHNSFETTVFIYDDKTLYISPKKENYAVLIQSKEHTKMMDAMFKNIWNNALEIK
ncbi:MAG: hypothetical protein IH840_06000 [Candidatus Heimdallarchaeota archaeon]|nr:hypothetical protein [Candidatus Heimdallarchaeota archaeon]